MCGSGQSAADWSRGLSKLGVWPTALACTLWLLVAQARAQPDHDAPGARCTALLVGSLDDELVARILGQSRDVACTLVIEPTSELSARKRASADAVLTLRSREAGGYELSVHSSRPAQGRVAEAAHDRRVPGAPKNDDDPLARSAAFEAVALVVRGELLELRRSIVARAQQVRERRARETRARESERAAAMEAASPPVGSDGEAVRHAAPEDGAVSAPIAASLSSRPHAVQPFDGGDAERSSNAWTLGLGWDVFESGASAPAHALAARVQRTLGPLELGAGAAFGLSAPLDGTRARALLQRHAAYGLVAWPWAMSDALGAELCATLGVAWFARSARVRDPTLEATADATLTTLMLGAEVALALRIVGPLGLRAAVALDALPAAPRYAYEQAGVLSEHTPARPLQPRAALSFTWRL